MKIWTCLIATLVATCAASAEFIVSEAIEISKVPSGFPVGFSLLTTSNRQYAAYYDVNRNMVVAARPLDSTEWIYQILPTKIEWDSHNYVTMALDGTGHLHVSGNMHCVPLIYFRTEKEGDITSLKAATMTGELEDRVTYPRFFEDNEGRLVFTYRHGGSGNGINIYNRYDTENKTWSRLIDAPLFDGEGKRNAYPIGPSRGPDGWFHVHWVWRDTPDCSTNQHLSYARSRDLIHWESAFGGKVDLPIRFDQAGLVVDPIPAGGGIINGGHRMDFDSDHKPVLAYHKSDENGNMQIYAARPEGGTWKRVVLTKWGHPVSFAGNGSMGFIGIRITGFEKAEPDVLSVGYRHKDHGSGSISFDARTLSLLVKQAPQSNDLPPALRKVESDFPGMEIRHASDSGACATPGVRYLLQWETLEANRDRPREPPLPAPSTLRLYKLTEAKK
jgi:BNR repeat-containing family member